MLELSRVEEDVVLAHKPIAESRAVHPAHLEGPFAPVACITQRESTSSPPRFVLEVELVELEIWPAPRVRVDYLWGKKTAIGERSGW